MGLYPTLSFTPRGGQLDTCQPVKFNFTSGRLLRCQMLADYLEKVTTKVVGPLKVLTGRLLRCQMLADYLEKVTTKVVGVSHGRTNHFL